MLGEVDAELADVIGVDTVGFFGSRNGFGLDESKLHEQVAPWGQTVLIAQGIDLAPAPDGFVYVYAEGDTGYPPTGRMPAVGGYFFDPTERQGEIDDDRLDPADNLEEFGPLPEAEVAFLAKAAADARATGKAVVASFGGTALGDIGSVPGVSLREPRGVRGIEEWYVSTMTRRDYIDQVFAGQIDLALANYERLWRAVGGLVDVVYLCGTDFGTQISQFYSVDTFRELWFPHYKRLNDWIHAHTSWRTMKHSCGAIAPLIPSLVEAGFDILNPLQISAEGMDPHWLKDTFGEQVVFWGGGVDTQRVLPFGTPAEVREQVLRQVETFGAGGGFVFNAVHDIQANAPVANVVAMIDALNEVRGIS
jgi:hypothetical protein